MKKISVACVLIFLLTLSFPAYPAHAEESFPVGGKCGENVTWSLDEDGTMVISGSGPMEDYVWENETPWSVIGVRDQIKNIVVTEGVTSIGRDSFYALPSLESAEIAGSVSRIGMDAFRNCVNLENVIIEDGCMRIDAGAFDRCGKLKNIELPDSIMVLDIAIFYKCSSLESIVLPEKLEVLPSDLFKDCSNLSEVVIGSNVKSVFAEMFWGCSSLSSIYFRGNMPTVRGVITYGEGETRDVFGSLNATVYYYADNTTWTQEAIQAMRSETFGGENLTFQAMSRTTDNNGTSSAEEDDDMSEDDTYDEEDETADPSDDEFLPDETAGLPGDESLPDDTTDLPDESEDGENEPSGSFADINPGDFYYNAVQWALENSITSGVDSDHFAPKEPCTRGQVVTFLWRAMGEPEPESAYNPFRDLSYNDYYYKAVLWAYQENITSGMTESAFGADAGCTRSQVVTFLWRANGRPDISYQGSFRDVPAGAYYASAVEWALANAVTSGTSLNTFSPDATCTRGQIVSFLYRSRS